MVKTKIIATLGPSSSNETILRKMYVAGLDVVRLNFSHGAHSEHIEKINTVRNLNRKMRRSIKILQDLAGFRIRVGYLDNSIKLKKKKTYYFTQNDIFDLSDHIPFDYRGSLSGILPGNYIYIDDGKLIFKVVEILSDSIKTIACTGGELKQRKGINIPEATLDFEALTDKDREDISAISEYGVDYVAQSFVRNAQDVKNVKDLVISGNPNCKIFAKIESRDAIENIDEIIDEADGIMVARGDMGICLPFYEVPFWQKRIVALCNKKNKPVIVATQMLDSMTDEVIPTRAEVSDVANAIIDGATHLMLSAESAVGKHPDLVVDTMNQIIKRYEKFLQDEQDMAG